MTKKEIRIVIGISIIFFLRMLGMFIILPAITSYEEYFKYYNKFIIGIAIAAYGITQTIFQIPFGMISDKWGRKPIIILGLLLLFFGSIIAALSNSIFGIIIGRCMQGAGAISSPMMALLFDTIKEKNRTQALAYIGMSFLFAFCISIILSPILLSNFGFYFLFWVIAFFSLFSIMLMILVIPNQSDNYLPFFNIKYSFLLTIKNKKLLQLNFGIFCLHIVLIFIFTIIPYQLIIMGILISYHWKIYFIIFIISLLLIIPYFLYIEKNYSKNFILNLSIIFIFFSQIILYFGVYYKSFILLMFGLQLFFYFFIIIEMIIPTLVSIFSNKKCKGTAISINTSSQFFGTAIGGTISGWIHEYYSINNVFLFGIFIIILWFFISNLKR